MPLPDINPNATKLAPADSSESTLTCTHVRCLDCSELTEDSTSTECSDCLSDAVEFLHIAKAPLGFLDDDDYHVRAFAGSPERWEYIAHETY